MLMNTAVGQDNNYAKTLLDINCLNSALCELPIIMLQHNYNC